MNIRIYSSVQITHKWMSKYTWSSIFFMNEYPNIFIHVVYSQMNVQINLIAKYALDFMINYVNFIKDKSNCFTFVVEQFLFCSMIKFDYIHWNLTIRIYSRGEKSLRLISKYIRLKKNAWIFGQINIFINKYSNMFEYKNICYTLHCTLHTEQ